ncbi:MAG: DUF1292 domain-containing protein [Syntrophomonadaceae bacterium]|nr:DUF1292 domain-containing protein [Syntrophomonadaceae bacterium]MDD3272042.1 DUF1292 domain-containing protein [Syntrophomonadaceae bacterium]MDD3899280.1 DUF1292 domain-containing protein [Syntrophomonadaceae bacterium]MDD4562803.1 DUF1292 domain-containing protein [Syntrophomonadaceae bacterium]
MSNEEELFDDEFYMMVLVDDEGGEHEFQLLVELEIEGETYRVLMPLSEEEEHEEEENDEIVILKVIYDEEGNELMSDIDDDEELDMVFEAWQELEDSLEI